jgi:hypothetical protein
MAQLLWQDDLFYVAPFFTPTLVVRGRTFSHLEGRTLMYDLSLSLSLCVCVCVCVCVCLFAAAFPLPDTRNEEMSVA